MKLLLAILVFSTISFSQVYRGYDYIHGSTLEILPEKKGTVLVFVSARCPCSNSHLFHLQDLVKQFPDFKFIGVHSNQDESLDLGKTYFAPKKLNYPVLRDEGAKLANQFGALKTPHAFVISADDKILYAGPVSSSIIFQEADSHYLQEFLESLKTGNPPPTIKKRPLGCYISRQ